MKNVISLLVVLAFATISQAQVINYVLDIFIAAPSVTLPAMDPTTGIPYPAAMAFGDGRGFNDTGTSRIKHQVDLNMSTLAATIHAPIIGSSTTTFLPYPLNGSTVPGNTVTATASGSAVHATVTYPNSHTVVIRFHGNPTNPTVAGSAGITYNFAITIDKNGNGGNGSYSVTYSADKFPSYRLMGGGATLVALAETSVFRLIPIFFQGSGTVSGPGFPGLSSDFYFNSTADFVSTYGKVATVTITTGTLPDVRQGGQRVTEFQDDGSGTTYYYDSEW